MQVVKKFQPIWTSDHRWIISFGGYGSSKSYSAAQWAISEVTTKINQKILVVRKVFNTHRRSTFQLIKEIIYNEGLESRFRINNAELFIEDTSTRSQIIFQGLDNVEKLKSIYGITSIWIEECTELTHKEVLEVNQRLRVKGKILLTFNPISDQHWVKEKLIDEPNLDKEVIHSNYKDNKFLSPYYVEELLKLKDIDPNLYKVACLGEFGVAQDLVFHNWEVLSQDPDPNIYDYKYIGMDYGYNHASVCLLVAYHDDEIYILQESYAREKVNADFIKQVNEEIPLARTLYGRADSASPGLIEEFRRAGYTSLEPTVKGPGSVKDSIDWLKARKINVAPSCIHTIKELQTFSYMRLRDDSLQDDKFSDQYGDDCIAALRYATEHVRKYQLPKLEAIPSFV